MPGAQLAGPYPLRCRQMPPMSDATMTAPDSPQAPQSAVPPKLPDLAQLPVALGLIDREQRICECSPALAAVLKLDSARVLGRRLDEAGVSGALSADAPTTLRGAGGELQAWPIEDGWLVGAAARPALSQALLEQAVKQLQACDLSLPPLGPELAVAPELGALKSGFGNLSEALRQAVDLVRQVAAAVPALGSGSSAVRAASESQVEELEQAQSAATQLAEGLRAAAGALDSVRGIADEAAGLAGKATRIADAFQQTMRAVEDSTRRADSIIEMIDTVALQTNILSINAGIEAARAGDAGRGFAVVAREIRALSERTAGAAREVRGTLDGIHERMGDGLHQAGETGQALQQVLALMQRAGEAMREGSQRVQAQVAEVGGLQARVGDAVGEARRNLESVEDMQAVSTEMAGQIEVLHDCVGLFRLPEDPLREPRHARALQLAQRGAEAAGRALEGLVTARHLDLEALFERRYQPIPRTEPQKHSTAFDALCDEVLPSLQEPLAATEAWVVYAICANRDGYVPTHNNRFCQPLTGDPKQDLVHNRTKRIFSDRVGRTVGAHTDPYRLQVYRRDTGQIMFDLSVPIRVHGRHWGGFRVGYALG